MYKSLGDWSRNVTSTNCFYPTTDLAGTPAEFGTEAQIKYQTVQLYLMVLFNFLPTLLVYHWQSQPFAYHSLINTGLNLLVLLKKISINTLSGNTYRLV